MPSFPVPTGEVHPGGAAATPASTRLSTAGVELVLQLQLARNEMEKHRRAGLGGEGAQEPALVSSGAVAQRAETRFHSFERVRTHCVPGTERGQRVGGRVRSRPHPPGAHSPSHKPSKASLT